MKLLFDECIGRGIYRALAAELDRRSPRVEHRHLLDLTEAQGVPDEDWVPRVAREGWIVVTGDSGRRGLGAPLHRLLPEHRVTAVFLSGKLQSAPHGEKVAAVRAVLDQLEASIEGGPAPPMPPGTRLRLMRTGRGGHALRPWPVQPAR